MDTEHRPPKCRNPVSFSRPISPFTCRPRQTRVGPGALQLPLSITFRAGRSIALDQEDIERRQLFHRMTSMRRHDSRAISQETTAEATVADGGHGRRIKRIYARLITVNAGPPAVKLCCLQPYSALHP